MVIIIYKILDPKKISGTPYTGPQYFGECANSFCDHNTGTCINYHKPGVGCDNGK